MTRFFNLIRVYLSSMALLFAFNVHAGETARPATEEKPPASGSAEANTWVESSLEIADIQMLLALLPLEQREAALGDEKIFEALVKQESAGRSLLAAARANGLEKEPSIQILMRRGAEKVLAENYLNRVILNNMPKDFPSAEQMQSFYDKNKEKFAAPERVHMWQIYFPVAADAKPDEDAAVKKIALQTSRAILAGDKDFAKAAAEQSKHQPSRVNAGYMGLINTAEILPEIKSQLDKLKPEVVSDPIRTKDGYHIVKKGQTVSAQELEFSDIQLQIKQLMMREAINELRAALVKKIQETYPVKYDDSKLNEWRDKLKTELAAAKQEAAKQSAKAANKKPAKAAE